MGFWGNFWEILGVGVGDGEVRSVGDVVAEAVKASNGGVYGVVKGCKSIRDLGNW